jgi:hypothetical protein
MRVCVRESEWRQQQWQQNGTHNKKRRKRIFTVILPFHLKGSE